MRTGWTALHYAAERGSIDIARLLIKKGAVVDAQSEDGATPLLTAIREERKGMAELLIGKGADLNAKDKEGRTPKQELDDKKAKLFDVGLCPTTEPPIALAASGLR